MRNHRLTAYRAPRDEGPVTSSGIQCGDCGEGSGRGDLDLHGRTAVVIGGSSGIGADVAGSWPRRAATSRSRADTSARRPIILVGLGVLWDRASAGVVALAERLGAPVMTTTKAKGVIPEDHPLRAGAMIGGLIEREIISQADLIVTIGLDGVELQPKPWPYSAPGAGVEQHAEH